MFQERKNGQHCQMMLKTLIRFRGMTIEFDKRRDFEGQDTFKTRAISVK